MLLVGSLSFSCFPHLAFSLAASGSHFITPFAGFDFGQCVFSLAASMFEIS